MSEIEERALFRRVADGLATEQEFRALEARLRVDPDLRTRYILHMGLEANLYEEMVSSPNVLTSTATVNSASGSRKWPVLFAFCGIAVGLLVGVFLQGLSWPRPFPEIALTDPKARQEETSSTTVPVLPEQHDESNWVEIPNSESLREVAIITYVDEAATKAEPKWFRAGSRLKPGTLTLPSGELQLDFVNGARILLKGPAVLQIDSVTNASLISGQAAARVPDSARGFVLNSPGTAVVDLGTEFSVNINETGESEVLVTEGEVEVSLLGQDGNTVRSQRLKETGALRIRQSRSELEQLVSPTPGQLIIPERELPKLPVSEQYVQTIKKARPFAYWRFEELIDGKVPNEMSEKFPAVLHHEDSPATVNVENGVAMFRISERPRYFSVDGGIPGWNSDSFSIEIWGCPDRLHHGALIDILSEDWKGDLNTIEIAMKTTLIHPPGAYRFFHRYPPGQDMKSGINLFDHQTCTPMQWTYLVATKSRDSLCLYVNGQLLRRIDGVTGSDNAVYQLAIGQMDNYQLHRQFEGALDEVALYHRALTADEVLQHYYQMMPQGHHSGLSGLLQ